MYPVLAIYEALGDDLSGGFLVFGDTIYRELRINNAAYLCRFCCIGRGHDGASARRDTPRCARKFSDTLRFLDRDAGRAIVSLIPSRLPLGTLRTCSGSLAMSAVGG